MSALIVMKPLTAIAATNPNANGDPSNALTPDPKEVVVAGGTVGTVVVRLDFGSLQIMDMVFVGFWSAHLAAVTATFGGAAPRDGPALAIPKAASDRTAPRRQHATARLGAPGLYRYVDFDIQRDGSGVDATAGIFAAGLAIQPAWGHEWGSGRVPYDMSVVSELRGGGYGIERGARKGGYQFQCGDLDAAEVAALWDMAMDVGVSAPVLVCEDPDATAGLNERLHYGLFINPQAYERQAPATNRWAFSVKEWV